MSVVVDIVGGGSKSWFVDSDDSGSPLSDDAAHSLTCHIVVIIFLFGTINFTTKDQSQPVWTGFFRIVDRLGPVFKGPVAVPQYLNQSRPVAVANCLVLKSKTRPDWTLKH